MDEQAGYVHQQPLHLLLLLLLPLGGAGRRGEELVARDQL